jgi:hypothetical protein
MGVEIPAGFDKYPSDIRGWIVAKGGIENMPVGPYWTLTASELWKMGHLRCAD